MAKIELKDMEERKKGGRKRKKGEIGDDFEDSETFIGVKKRVKGGGGKRNKKSGRF